MSSKPDFHDINYINSLVGALWPVMAPFAYQQFLAKSRGAVVIDLNKMTDTVISRTEVECIGELDYKTKATPDGNITQIDKYDPEKSIALIIDHRPYEDEPGVSYRHVAISTYAPSPKESYESMSSPPEYTLPLPFNVRITFSPQSVDINEPETQKRLIQEGWENFAAIAYGHYLEYGRGMVVIDMDSSQISTELLTTSVNMRTEYVELNDPKMNNFKESIRKVVQIYDPEEKAIFIFPKGQPNSKGFIESNMYVAPLGNALGPKILYEYQKRPNR